MSGGESDPVMTVSEVAAYLKIAESTVYRLVKEGRLPGRKVGGAWRFSRQELEKWLVQPTGAEELSGLDKEAGAESDPLSS